MGKKSFSWKLFRWWHDWHGHETLQGEMHGSKIAYHLDAPFTHRCSCGKELGMFFFVSSGWWEAHCKTHTEYLSTYGPPL